MQPVSYSPGLILPSNQLTYVSYFHAKDASFNLPAWSPYLLMSNSIAGLGFTTTINAQLLTVPVYFVAAISFVILGYLSDKYKNRSTFLLIALTSCLIGYIILIASPSAGVRYFGVFMVAVGLYAT